MIHAYSESYLYDAKQNLSECFDYAISNCRFNADIFSKLFVQSGYADKFERGNPAIVSGISGIELAQEIIMYAYMNYKFPEKIFSEERSEVFVPVGFMQGTVGLFGWLGFGRVSVGYL